MAPDDPRARAVLYETTPLVVSAGKRKKIERDFTVLVDFVFGQADWPLGLEIASCLTILHRFRSAAYHRDTVHADVLGPAVNLYFNLVALLLKNRRTVVWVIDEPPAGVREFSPTACSARAG